MARFTDLPNELLFRIFEYTLPYHFENVVVCSRQFYEASKPLLGEHNKLRKRFRSFYLYHRFAWDGKPRGEVHYLDVIDRPAALLLEIAENPIIADYIVNLDLNIREHAGLYASDGDYVELSPSDSLARLKTPEALRSIERLVKASTFQYYGDEGMQELSDEYQAWAKDILELSDKALRDEIDLPTALLLTLLPNVESLTLPASWKRYNVNFISADEQDYEGNTPTDCQRACSALMYEVIQRAKNKDLQDQSLAKLQKILSTEDIDTQFGEDMVTIAPFLALSSLREVHHASCIVLDGELGTKKSAWYVYFQRDGPLDSNLEVLDLKDYAIDAEAASVLLKHMHKLRVFNLEYNMKDEIAGDIVAQDMVDHLMLAAGNTIEELSLTMGDCCPYYSIKSPIRDLSGFSKLKRFTLDTSYLYSCNDEDDNGPGWSSSCRSFRELFCASLMTLEEIVLYVPLLTDDFLCLKRLLRDLTYHSATNTWHQLPNLKAIRVHSDIGESPAAEEKDRIPHEDAEMQLVALKNTYGITYTIADYGPLDSSEG